MPAMQPADTAAAFAQIVTRDRKMQSIFRYMEVIAPTTQPVISTAESTPGTGTVLHIWLPTVQYQRLQHTTTPTGETDGTNSGN